MPRPMYAQVDMDYAPDGVYLSLPAPEPPDEPYLLNWIGHCRLQGVNLREVMSSIRSGDRRIRLCDPQDPAAVDEGLFIEIERGDMRAFAQIFPATTGVTLTESDVLERMHQAGIDFGEDIIAIRALLSAPYGERVCVAAGRPPVEGADGEIIYHFRTKLTGQAVVDDKDRANYWDLDLIERCAAGQVLVTRTLPIPGESGRSVRGADIPANPVRDIPLPPAKNASVFDDGLALIADLDGKVALERNRVVVSNVYAISGNVDMSVGNVDFGGSVEIGGAVLAGMKVVARGSLQVKGIIEAASVKADGDMALSRGVQGADRADIRCEGDLAARFLERASVVVKGDILADAIIHSHVECGNALILTGKRGALIGGVARAGSRIIARTVGSTTNTQTVLEVGVTAGAPERIQQIDAELDALHEEMGKMHKLLKSLSTAGRDPEKRAILERIGASLEATRARSDALLDEQRHLRERILASANGKVHVLERAYPGTRIVMGNATYIVRSPIEFATFRKDKSEIVLSACDYVPDEEARR